MSLLSLMVVQGTASAELITGLRNWKCSLVNGAAAVLWPMPMMFVAICSAQDETFAQLLRMVVFLTLLIVHTAGIVFNDAVTKLIGGVYVAIKHPSWLI